ncbi:MAG: type II toxin-antitoxin system ParD family antitoxin, partial [Myxococcota bacterium]
MDVFLTRDLEAWIRERVSGGEYSSEGHLVRHALRLLRERDDNGTDGQGDIPVQPHQLPRELRPAA